MRLDASPRSDLPHEFNTLASDWMVPSPPLYIHTQAVKSSQVLGAVVDHGSQQATVGGGGAGGVV